MGPRKSPRSQESIQLDHTMLEMYADGKTLREIGDSFGITRERVRQRIALTGVDSELLRHSRALSLPTVSKVKRGQEWIGINTDRAAFQQTWTAGKHTPEYMAYRAMLARCYNPNNPKYDTYGGRGVTVCDRWLGKEGFTNFYNDVGPRPADKHASGRAVYSLHRIDNVPIYSPETVKWATGEEQCHPSQRRMENIIKASIAARLGTKHSTSTILKLRSSQRIAQNARQGRTVEEYERLLKEANSLYKTGLFTYKEIANQIGLPMSSIGRFIKKQETTS